MPLSALTTMTMDELPGFPLHLTTTAKMKTIDEAFEEHMKWLREALEQATREYGREEIAMFPKTPAMKRRRQRIRRVSTIHSEETENQPPVRSKRSSRASVLSKARQSKEQAVPLRRSARASARKSVSTRTCRSRSRTLKKVQMNDSIEPMQDFSSSDTSSCSDYADGTENAVSKDEPKRSTDSGVVTTTEASVECPNKETPDNTTNTNGGKTEGLLTQRSSKRSATSRNKQAAKKLRLNSKEGISAASDNATSDECETGNPENSPRLIEENKVDSLSSSPKNDAEQVTSETKIAPAKTSTATCPKRKNAASRYKDHVKRLINHHEHLIADQTTSSDDEFQSPKCKRALREAVQKVKQPARGKKNQWKSVDEETKSVSQEMQEGIVPQKTNDDAISAERGREQASPKSSPLDDATEKHNNMPETVTNENSTMKVVEEMGVEIGAEKVSKPSEVMSSDKVEAGIDEDSLNQRSVAEDSLEQRSIMEDSLDRKESPESISKQGTCAPNQGSRTTDSLDQQNITDDSLNHNDISHDSLNQSTSKLRVTRQSLRRNLRKSSRRSSVAVSHSKKRSSIYHHRTSVRKSLRQSLRNHYSNHASRRVSKQRTTMEEVPQDIVRDQNQDVVMEEMESEEDATNTPNEKRITPSKRMSMRPSTINQGTQRITRASSRIADKQNTTPDEPRASSQASESDNSPSEISSDDDLVGRTPSPECPANKVVRPRGTFLSSGKKETKYLNNLHGMVSSFLKRNTPQKQSATERREEMKKQILSKQKRDDEIRRKLEADKQRQREIQKRKREERIKKVTETRERHAALQEQKRQELEQKRQQMNKLTSKQREDKKQEETQRKQIQMKKKVEAEERRRQEEQVRLLKIQEQEEEQRRHREMILRKKEFEEQERQRRIDEARRQQEQRRAEMDRQRQEELQRRREQELAKEREQQLLKEERERERKAEMEYKREQERRAREEALEKERQLEAERAARERERQKDQKYLAEMMQRERERRELERQQQEKAEHERLKASILKHNTSTNLNTSSCLNTTVTKDAASPTSYDMTPQRVLLPSTSENYNIDDLDSGDSTDEEDAPKKTIPSWAQGAGLKAALIKQHYHPPPMLDTMFGPLVAPDLNVIFAKKRPRFVKRTSSAVWDSPLLKV